MNILHVTPTFYPATFYGGPIAATYALCNALARIPGVVLKVLATDAAGLLPTQRLDVPAVPMTYPCGYEVYFARRLAGREFAPGLLARLWPMIGWADVVHLTGVYSLPTIPTLLVSKLRRRPVLWSPRGSLLASHTWEGASRRRIKLFWERLSEFAMPARTMLHVTSEEERAASLARLPFARAEVIANGVDIPELEVGRSWRPDGVIRLMFMGRIDPVKGIERVIEAVSLIEQSSVRLDVYGAGADPYVASLRELTRRLGVDGLVRFHGAVAGEAKRAAFAEADACILASYSENFGMVVAEALAHGVPVVVSKGAPWSDVATQGCGVWVDNTPQSLAIAIRSLRSRDLAAMGAAGRRWMGRDFGWDPLAARTLEVMRELVRQPFRQSPAASSGE